MSPVKTSVLDCPVPAVGVNLLKPVDELAVKCKIAGYSYTGDHIHWLSNARTYFVRWGLKAVSR